MSLQHAFENLEAEAKDGIVDELLNQGFGIFSEVAKSQWGSYCIQHSSFSILLIKSDNQSNLTFFSKSWSTVPKSTKG